MIGYRPTPRALRTMPVQGAARWRQQPATCLQAEGAAGVGLFSSRLPVWALRLGLGLPGEGIIKKNKVWVSGCAGRVLGST